MNKAVGAELDEEWKGAYVEVHNRDVPLGANDIGSHVVYKVKVKEGVKRLKERL